MDWLTCSASRKFLLAVGAASAITVVFLQAKQSTHRIGPGLPASATLAGNAASREGEARPIFPERPSAQQIEPGVDLFPMTISGTGPGLPMKLHLFLPSTPHAPHSLPCVFIAPAGTWMHGGTLEPGDMPEHVPYARAGFAVVAYELSGAAPTSNEITYDDLQAPVRQFMDADGGLANARLAIAYALEKVPEVDPARLFAVGHSSAGVVALNLAASDRRIRACVAYAPRTDVEEWWKRQTPPLEELLPGFAAFAVRHSPRRHVKDFACPIYLFHADDDSAVKSEDNELFAAALRTAGKQILFVRVPTGEHYPSMIAPGIPGAIEWMKSLSSNAAGDVASKGLTPLPPPQPQHR